MSQILNVMNSSRPFSCTICTQTFTRSENLERHKRTRHGTAGHKQFKCELCQAVFGRRDICKRHQERCDGRANIRKARRDRVDTVTASSTPEDVQVESLEEPKAIAPQLFTHPQIFPEITDPQLHFFQDTDLSPLMPPFVCSIIPDELHSSCVASYFSEFHPNFPILHEATFSLHDAPKPLSDMVLAIGNIYRCRIHNTMDKDAAHEQSTRLWESSMDNIQLMSATTGGLWKEVWILQASLLAIVYGAFAAEQFNKSRQVLAKLIGDVRETGLLQQHTCGHYFANWRQKLSMGASLSPADLQEAWLAFVYEESLKLALFGLTLIDSQLVIACNTRPEMSTVELLWELPWSMQAWQAQDSIEWLQHMNQDYSDFPTEIDFTIDRGSSTKSTLLATQAFLSSVPQVSLLRAVSRSPFSAYCITANIYRIVRGFTHFMYQLPANPANPSPFHILTHSQNSQISTALKVMLEIKTSVGNGPYMDCWNAVEILCLSTKVSLCLPDDLMICGIVDSNIAASFATAAHLSMGNQILGRRSRETLPTPRNFNDEGFLLIFEDLIRTLDLLWNPDAVRAMKEAPWISVVGLRMLLDLFKVLRLAMAELRGRIDVQTPHRRTNFDPAQIMVDTVKDTLAKHIREKRTQLSTHDLQELGLLEMTEHPKITERKFMLLMIHCCNDRNVWTVGRAMAMVLEELSNGLNASSMRS